MILVVPWLPPEEQPQIFPHGMVFQTKDEHAAYILATAKQRTGLPCDFRCGCGKVRAPSVCSTSCCYASPAHAMSLCVAFACRVLFYEGKYFTALGSIVPIGDVTSIIPQEEVRWGPAWPLTGSP